MRIKKCTVTSCPPGTSKKYPKSETSFDERGNKTEVKSFLEGKISFWEQYIYDTSNNLVEIIEYTGNSYKIEDYRANSITYSSRIQGEKWIEETGANGLKVLTVFHSNGTIKKRKYLNKQLMCYEENGYIKGAVRTKIIYEYNDKNQLTRCKKIGRRVAQLSDEEGRRKGDYYIKDDRNFLYDNEGFLIEESHEYWGSTLIEKHIYNEKKLIETENILTDGVLTMVCRYTYTFW